MFKKDKPELAKYIEQRNADRELCTSEFIFRINYTHSTIKEQVKELIKTRSDINFIRYLEKFYDLSERYERDLFDLINKMKGD